MSDESTRHVLDAAAAVCGVEDIRRRCRFVAHVRARRIVSVYLTKQGIVQREIAALLGRDRSTISDLVSCHDALILSDPAYRTAWQAFVWALDGTV